MWGAYTGPPAPLYSAVPSNKYSSRENVHASIKYYACSLGGRTRAINMGWCERKLQYAPSQKHAAGVPFYGRYWRHVGEPNGSVLAEQ